MRSLDADKVLVFKLYDDLTEEFYEKEFTIQNFIDTYAVDGCPKPVDAEPVIRCKDCKYWKMNITVIPTSETDKAMYCTRYMWMTHTDADDFCSRGERKDD